MEITICIGSSCHMKGARTVVSELEKLIEQYALKDKVHLKGSFCMGKCSIDGVSVRIEEDLFYLKPENITQFFQNEVLRRITV